MFNFDGRLHQSKYIKKLIINSNKFIPLLSSSIIWYVPAIDVVNSAAKSVNIYKTNKGITMQYAHTYKQQ